MSDGIDEDQSAPDLTSELEAAFDASVVEDVSDEASVVKDEPQLSVDEDTTASKEPAAEEPAERAGAPENWSGADKDTFKALNDLGEQGQAAQDFLLARHKSMEGDYTQKSQQNAASIKEYEPIKELFDNYAPQLSAQGQTPIGKIKEWANVEQNLANDPRATLQYLAQQYGVTFEGGEMQQADPAMANIQSELNALRSSITQREQADAKVKQNTVESQISEFNDAKTEAGDLAHPHFADVMDEIVVLAQAERQAGREPELQNLYDKAVWMNTSVREKLITSQRESEESKRTDDARQKAAKAKRAGSSISGAPDGASPTSDLSLRDQLAQGFE